MERNCNSRQENYSEPQVNPENRGEGLVFRRGKEEAEKGCFADFSVAGLLLGREKFFLLLGHYKVSCFLLGNVKYATYKQVVTHDSSPFRTS